LFERSEHVGCQPKQESAQISQQLSLVSRY
jgi:hypothetical protein